MLKPFLLFAVACATPLYGADYYVSPQGDDAHPGTSVQQPFRTLQRADSAVQPGDTVWIMAGTYRNSETGDKASVLTTTRSGTADAWITWRNYGNDRPELIAENCGYGIQLAASYIVVDGLILTGNNDNVRQADAEANAEIDVAATRAAWLAEGALELGADYSSTPSLKAAVGTPAAPPPAAPPRRKSRPRTFQEPSSLYNSSGIAIDCRPRDSTLYHHHILRNLVIRKFGTAGIALLGTDYATVENCEVYDNSWYGRYGSSGITFNSGRHFDRAPGYHFIFRRNRIWNNKNLVRCYFVDLFTDGNGLIIDSMDEVPAENSYTGGILIENNLVYNNGGAGIHVYKSHHARIDIVSNTLWRNQQMWQLYDLGGHNISNVHFYNNIVVADRYRQVNGKPEPGVVYDYNLYSGSPLIGAKGANDLIGDPLFVLPSTNRRAADFSLSAGSPALDNAGGEKIPAVDLLGTPRPRGAGADRGAFERREPWHRSRAAEPPRARQPDRPIEADRLFSSRCAIICHRGSSAQVLFRGTCEEHRAGTNPARTDRKRLLPGPWQPCARRRLLKLAE